MSNPTVSCIIPVYLGERLSLALLERAVQSALRQTRTDIEILLVDDCSPSTVHLDISDPRLRVVRRPVRGGAGAARNTGIAQARGQYLAFLDADDEWLLNKLALQLEFLHTTGTRLAVCGYEYSRADIGETTVRIPYPIDTTERLAFGCDANIGSAFICEASVFADIGPFDEDFERFEDWDWLFRSVEKGLATSADPRVLVKVYNQGWPSPAVVDRNARLLYRRHARHMAAHPSNLLKFSSAILLEIAAAHLHAGRRANSITLALAALLIWPFRNRTFFVNAMKRLRQTRSGQSDRVGQS
jgi:glycosyltransferase involved in cell wall biosynthesis